MSKLIDADALEKDGWMMHRTVMVDKNTMEYQTKKPTDFHTIEPERKTGKWIHGRELSWEMIGDVVTAIFYEGWECSECHCLVSEEREPLWKFCPNCGLKMTKEGEK